MSDAMYYEKPVLLNRDTHRRRRVAPSKGFDFARKANSMFLAGVEFNEACKEYAVVFTQAQGGRVMPVAILGLRARENLFVDEEARWDARYIPAFVRRYPFVLAELQGQAMGVCIDEAFPGWSDRKGEPLFDANGENTPFLQNALDFLHRYQVEYLRTDTFCKRLRELGLLREMNAKADLADGRSFTINGLMVVDEQKLHALPDAAVLTMFRAGELHWIAMHLSSLSNMQLLVDRMAARKSELKPAPKPEVTDAKAAPRPEKAKSPAKGA